MEEHYNGEITKVNPPFKHPLFKTEYKLTKLKWKYCHKDYADWYDEDKIVAGDYELVGDVMFTNSSKFYRFKTLIMRSNVTKEDLEQDGEYEFFETIYLPNSLTEIPSECIDAQDLLELQIPTSVKKICNDAFGDLRSMNKLIIPNSVKYIGKTIFDHWWHPVEVELSKNTKCHVLAFYRKKREYNHVNNTSRFICYKPIKHLKIIRY
ncbi:hypothetical protein QTN25_010809 [Entamoeba marina]